MKCYDVGVNEISWLRGNISWHFDLVCKSINLHVWDVDPILLIPHKLFHIQQPTQMVAGTSNLRAIEFFVCLYIFLPGRKWRTNKPEILLQSSTVRSKMISRISEDEMIARHSDSF